jgi:hypothetical protein
MAQYQVNKRRQPEQFYTTNNYPTHTEIKQVLRAITHRLVGPGGSSNTALQLPPLLPPGPERRYMNITTMAP